MRKLSFILVTLQILAAISLVQFFIISGDNETMIFPDVPSSFWAFSEINEIRGRGIIQGYPDGSFRPNAPVTRGEFSKMLVGILNIPTGNANGSSFYDVNVSEWYSPFVESAKNYIKWYKDDRGNTFNPNEGALRADIIVALVKAKGWDPNSAELSYIRNFNDYSSILTEDRNYLALAVGKNLVQGYPDNTFSPSGVVTRAETARLIYMAFIEQSANGTSVSYAGDVYTGELKNGVPDGTGQITFASGDKYIGSFKDGKQDGKGKLIYADGRVYEGDFKQDRLDGQGTYTTSELTYVGTFKNDCFEGNGVMTFDFGDKYVGEFKNNLYHGQGMMTFASGETYVGRFRNNEFDGYGVLMDGNGNAIYEGDFQNNTFNGYGIFMNNDGSILYEGEWEDGVPV